MDEQSIPQKRCVACEEEHPATAEFFRRNKNRKDGLMTRCKHCMKNGIRRKSKLQREGYKYCAECKKDLPATTEYWHRQKGGKYDLCSQCRECRNKKEGERHSRPGTRERNIARMKDYRNRPENLMREKSYRRRPEIKERRRQAANLPERLEYRKNYQKTYRARSNARAIKQARMKAYNNRPEVQHRNRVKSSNRHALKKSVKGTYTPEQIQDQLKRQKHKCYYCSKRFQKVKGRYAYHIEHTFPLSRVAGTDIPANSIDYLVLACPHCNVSKKDKFPWEWAEGGRLL